MKSCVRRKKPCAAAVSSPPRAGERRHCAQRSHGARGVARPCADPARAHPRDTRSRQTRKRCGCVHTRESVGVFDLVLLGLGEDGHTASLFPGHPLGAAPNDPPALVVHDAPKSPPERVSLGAARLSAARRVFFLVTGSGKREALARLSGGNLPAAHIRPAAGAEFFVTADVPADAATPR